MTTSPNIFIPPSILLNSLYTSRFIHSFLHTPKPFSYTHEPPSIPLYAPYTPKPLSYTPKPPLDLLYIPELPFPYTTLYPLYPPYILLNPLYTPETPYILLNDIDTHLIFLILSLLQIPIVLLKQCIPEYKGHSYFNPHLFIQLVQSGTIKGLDSTIKGLDSTIKGLHSTVKGLHSTIKSLDSTI